MGFLPALTIVFIVLKLANIITWSWIWVLSPLLFLILLFMSGALWVIYIEDKNLKARKNRLFGR